MASCALYCSKLQYAMKSPYGSHTVYLFVTTTFEFFALNLIVADLAALC